MTAPILVPFNFESIEDLTSSSYTVPDGSYVYAEPLDVRCTVDGDLFIVFTETLESLDHTMPSSGDYRVRTSTGAGTQHAIKYITGSGVSTSKYDDPNVTSSTSFISDSNVISSTLSFNSANASGGTVAPMSIQVDCNGGDIIVDKIERRSGWHKQGVVLAGGAWYIRRFRSLRA